MNLPPQPPSPEESEQQSALHSSEDNMTQPSATPDDVTNETEQDQLSSVSTDAPLQAAPSSETEPFAEEMEPQPASTAEPGEAQSTTLDEHNVLTSDDIEDATVDDEDELSDDEYPSSPQASSGIFINTKVLIAAISAVVLVAILAGVLVFINRPQDPPTDWIASYTPPAGTGAPNKVLYYIHWTNQNGKLDGQMQLAANVNGTTQSVTGQATGLYNRDNHIIYVVVMLNGQPSTLTGTINGSNDTLTLNVVGAQGGSPFIFHTGSENDYKQQTKQLSAK